MTIVAVPIEKEAALELSNEIKKLAEPKINASDCDTYVRREFQESKQGKYIELKFLIYYEEK